MNPEYAEAHLYLGLALEKVGKLWAALESISKALKINPNLDEAHFKMGIVLGKLGKL
jgi:protein O-GlcNAc transferase